MRFKAVILIALLFSLSYFYEQVTQPYIYDVRTSTYSSTSLSQFEFWHAWHIAQLAYGGENIAPPRGVILISSYIFQDNIAGFYDIPTKQIWLNWGGEKLRSVNYMAYVLVHEMGHHILTAKGVSTAVQHCKMYTTLDIKALGFMSVPENKIYEYIDPFTVMGACSPPSS